MKTYLDADGFLLGQVAQPTDSYKKRMADAGAIERDDLPPIPERVAGCRWDSTNSVWIEPIIVPTYGARDIRITFTDTELEAVVASENAQVKVLVLKLQTLGGDRIAADDASLIASVALLDSLGLAPQAFKDLLVYS